MSDFPAPELTLEAPIEASGDDALGFDSYATRLAGLILKAQTPFTVAIEGAWGSGKSSMMNLIKDHVKDQAVVIAVSVWELATQEEVWHAFVQAMFNQVNDRVPIWRRLNWRKLGRWLLENIWWLLLVIVPLVVAGLVQLNGGPIFFGAVAALVILWQTVVYPAVKAGAAAIKPFDLNEMLKTPSYKEQISLLTELQRKFAKLAKATNRERVVVFIDDLDRCDAAQIPAVIEALKLFITVKNCVYVVGVDRGIVENALVKERGLTPEGAREYLDKVVQLWFPMPEFDVEKARRYVVKQLKDVDLPEDVKTIAPELFVGLLHTPRRFKQAVNRYKALLAVRSPAVRARFGELAVLQMFLIEQAIPKLYTFLKNYPGYSYALWQHVYRCYQRDRDWYAFAYRNEEGQLEPGFRSLSIWRGYLKGLIDNDDEDKYPTPFESEKARLTRDDISSVTLIVSESQEQKGRPAFPHEIHEWVDCVNLTLPDANLEERLNLVQQISAILSDNEADRELTQTQIKALGGAEARIEALARDWRGYDPLRVFNSIWVMRAYGWFQLSGVFRALMRANELRGADLSDADMEGAVLYGAHMEGANLRKAYMEGTNLSDAHVERADLSFVQFERADLSDAHMEGAILRFAQFEGADLIVAVLLNANLKGTRFNDKTALPDAEIKKDETGNWLKGNDGKEIYDKYWTPDTDMSRYTNPEHPEFWLPEWYKDELARAAKKRA